MRAAASFESRTTDGINCVLASSRREARTRARDRERTLARVTREPRSSRGDFYRIGFFGLQEGRSFPPRIARLSIGPTAPVAFAAGPIALLSCYPQPLFDRCAYPEIMDG